MRNPELSKYSADMLLQLVLHELNNSLVASRHAVWSLKHRKGKHTEMLLDDLDKYIGNSLEVINVVKKELNSRDT